MPSIPTPPDTHADLSALYRAWQRWDRLPGDAAGPIRIAAELAALGIIDQTGVYRLVADARRAGSHLADAIRSAINLQESLDAPQPAPPAEPAAELGAAPPAPPQAPVAHKRAYGRYRTIVPGADDSCGDLGDAGIVASYALGYPGDLERVVWLHETLNLDLSDDSPFWRGPGFTDDHRDGQVWHRITMGPGEAPVYMVDAAQTAFAGTPTPADLALALDAYRDATGVTFLNSAGSTGHALIRTNQPPHSLTAPHPEPAELAESPTGGPVWADSAWYLPGHSWHRAPLGEEPGGFLRAYDRNGSYLAVWSGLNLSDGPWTHHVVPQGIAVDPGPEAAKPVGYWLIDWADVAHLTWIYDRIDVDGRGVWLTTPLLQLAAEQFFRVHGSELGCREVWWAERTIRPLDKAARILAGARDTLAGPALLAVKHTYAESVAWFEFSHKGDDYPLHRPYWRRAIIDKHVANTYRGVLRCPDPPLAQTDIDTVWWPVPHPDAHPPELRIGTGLGAWKPKGTALPVAGPIADVLRSTGTRWRRQFGETVRRVTADG
jgi:hypothetical protein